MERSDTMVRKSKKRIPVNSPEDSKRTDATGTRSRKQEAPAESAEHPSNTDGASDSAPSEIESLRVQLAEAKDQFLRAKAEQQNMQRRAAQERSDAVRYANATLIRNLLGTIDDFERTLEHSAGTDLETVLKGVRLIYDNLCKVLQDDRVVTIDPLDEDFDPRCHQAVLQQTAPDKKPGTVIQVVQRGYRLDERVLRPAKVIIAAGPEDADQAEQAPATREGEADTTAPEAVREQR